MNPFSGGGSCPRCGAPLEEPGRCSYCGPSVRPPRKEPPPRIRNHMVPAVLMTSFCCLPFGIAAVISAASVDALVKSGDYPGARAASERTKAILIWGTVVTLLTYLSYGLMCGVFEKAF